MGGSYQPPWRRAKQFIALAPILALVLPGCASRNAPPMGLGGKLFRPESDERKLWSQADKLRPDAPDARQIKGYLVELDR